MVDKKPDVVTYTYKGMTELEASNWMEAMLKGIRVPQTDEYQTTEGDSASTIRHKEQKRKKFVAERKKEIKEKLDKHQASRTIAGVCFEKGKPVRIDEFYAEKVIFDPETFEPTVKKTKFDPSEKLLAKLDSLCIEDVLERNPPLKGTQSAQEKAVLNVLNPLPRKYR